VASSLRSHIGKPNIRSVTTHNIWKAVDLSEEIMSSSWRKLRTVFFLGDEEMGKKNDDHKPIDNGKRNAGPWLPATRVPPRRSMRRILFLLLISCAVYFFMKQLPEDLTLGGTRQPHYIYPEEPQALDHPPPVTPSTVDTPEESNKIAADARRQYNGPVKFLNLATSLHAISGTRGGMYHNKNVLFAAASLKSAASLLPIACQMGMELRNYVHFALMSRSGIDMEELRKINGIDDECHIIFHGTFPSVHY
jgi:hypothetical protein